MSAPVIRVTRHDLLSVLTGSTMTVSTDGGDQVRLRLFTPEEFMAANRASIAQLFPDGGGPEPVSLERANELTRPTPESLIWGGAR